MRITLLSLCPFEPMPLAYSIQSHPTQSNPTQHMTCQRLLFPYSSTRKQSLLPTPRDNRKPQIPSFAAFSSALVFLVTRHMLFRLCRFCFNAVQPWSSSSSSSVAAFWGGYGDVEAAFRPDRPALAGALGRC